MLLTLGINRYNLGGKNFFFLIFTPDNLEVTEFCVHTQSLRHKKYIARVIY